SRPHDRSESSLKDSVTLFSNALCHCGSWTISWAEISVSFGASCGVTLNLNGNAADRKKRLNGFNGWRNSSSDTRRAKPVCRSVPMKLTAIGRHKREFAQRICAIPTGGLSGSNKILRTKGRGSDRGYNPDPPHPSEVFDCGSNVCVPLLNQ